MGLWVGLEVGTRLVACKMNHPPTSPRGSILEFKRPGLKPPMPTWLAADYADLAIDDNEREDRKLDALLSSREVVSRGGHIYRYDFEGTRDEGCVQIRVSTVMLLSAARVVPSEAAQTKSNSKFKIYNKTRR